MTESERYLKAKDIFLQALEKNPQDREQHIAQACAGDDELLHDVLNLIRGDLRADEEWETNLRAQVVEQLNALPLTEMPPYPIGEKLGGRYLIQRKLGQGGIGTVYLASDTRLYSRLVVIKLLLDTSGQNQYLVDKFKHEGEAMARIKHSGVAGVLDLGELPDGKPYLVMEFVEGETLASEIEAGAMDFGRAVGFIRQIAQALFAAHYEGIVHRDLKPANVMIQHLSDGTEQAKLIDFGIAKIANPLSADATQMPVIIGTPAYMASEQLEKGEASPASDIYALGAMAYEMLTGARPFTIDTTSITWPIDLVNMQRAGVSAKPKEFRADLPDAAQEEILKALSYHPEQRHQQAYEFGESLYRALTNENHIEPSKIDLATQRSDGSNQLSRLSFKTGGMEPVNRGVESFDRLWSNATFTDRIRPLPLESAKEERTQQLRGMGAKPKPAQYVYRLGSELCLALAIGGGPRLRGMGAKPTRGGYLTLLDKGAEDIVYCLCPSHFAPNTRLESGRIYLPQEGSLYEAFELSGAPGKEKLLAIITDEPLGFDWLPRDAETPARVLQTADLEALFARLQQLGAERWTALSAYFEVVT
jgi:serine/threonine protein kinase